MVINESREGTWKITVPKGVRYISQWQDFGLLPFPHILDKQIPGCGFTEYCLTNHQDLVLCSPRKLLLENKYDQHKEDIYYVINSFERELGIDKDITKNSRTTEKDIEDSGDNEDKRLEYYNWLKSDIEKYILIRKELGKPFKIIVTYDSFYLVKGILSELPITTKEATLNGIQFVVDEMQSVFVDASFKSSTEMEFVEVLKGIQNLCFVSATPMIEEYLRQVDIFKDLPYYELDWITEDPVRVKKPELKTKVIKSVSTTASEIIQTYLNGDFDYKYVKRPTGEIVRVESKEAVFYLNSVNNILNVIKSCGLKSEQVNILVANTPENVRKIKRRLGSKFLIGCVPLKGEPHKMFTFCTRTVYLGADFYSTNARTIVLSDANIETLMVDISLDLPQILGRQRLIENPWKDEAEFYYKTIGNGKIKSREDFNSFINEKLNSTESLLIAFKSTPKHLRRPLVEKYERDAINSNYKYDYVSVNRVLGTDIKTIATNNLVRIAEQRAFDIQQVDYKDRFNVFSSISNANIDSDYQTCVKKFFEEFEQIETISKKLKFFCDYQCSDEIRNVIVNQITEKNFREYITTLGVDGIRASGYNVTRINKKLGIVTFDKNKLINKICLNFKVGEKYSLAYIKEKLREIYTEVGYNKKPVASDIKQWFNVKENIKLKDKSGKWVRGVELL